MPDEPSYLGTPFGRMERFCQKVPGWVGARTRRGSVGEMTLIQERTEFGNTDEDRAFEAVIDRGGRIGAGVYVHPQTEGDFPSVTVVYGEDCAIGYTYYNMVAP